MMMQLSRIRFGEQAKNDDLSKIREGARKMAERAAMAGHKGIAGQDVFAYKPHGKLEPELCFVQQVPRAPFEHTLDILLGGAPLNVQYMHRPDPLEAFLNRTGLMKDLLQIRAFFEKQPAEKRDGYLLLKTEGGNKSYWKRLLDDTKNMSWLDGIPGTLLSGVVQMKYKDYEPVEKPTPNGMPDEFVLHYKLTGEENKKNEYLQRPVDNAASRKKDCLPNPTWYITHAIENFYHATSEKTPQSEKIDSFFACLDNLARLFSTRPQPLES